MSARTLREGASVGSAPLRATLKGPNSHTATERRDAQTSFVSNAGSHPANSPFIPTPRNAGKL
jgi:hypothetical protein